MEEVGLVGGASFAGGIGILPIVGTRKRMSLFVQILPIRKKFVFLQHKTILKMETVAMTMRSKPAKGISCADYSVIIIKDDSEGGYIGMCRELPEAKS